jgi:hypothetical protein
MRRSLTPAVRLLATIALAGATTLPALADPSADLRNALATTAREPSYHMTMTSSATGVVEADMVNPGRMHMVMKKMNMESIVIGDTMYMKQNGVWRKLPGSSTGAASNPLKAMAAKWNMVKVTDLGQKLAAGSMLHAYRVTNLRTQSTDTVFLDGSGRMVRFEQGTTVFEMSKFGEPVTIVAPI